MDKDGELFDMAKEWVEGARTAADQAGGGGMLSMQEGFLLAIICSI